MGEINGGVAGLPVTMAGISMMLVVLGRKEGS